MARSFAELRASQTNVMDNLKQKFETAKKSTSRDPTLEDETFWTIKHLRGPDGVGHAKIRLLPAIDGEDSPFIRYYEYAFKGSKSWYINKSRMTLGAHEQDPAYEYNGKIFGDESLTKEQKSKKLLQRNVHYVCNILVLKDPNMPENEGKVFRWRYGPQFFNIIEATMFPDKQLFPDKEGINVYDPFDGANFNIRVYTKEIPNPVTGQLSKVPSYEKSSFDETRSSVVAKPEDFDDIWNRQYSLSELITADKFKSYDELVKEFNRAMGTAPQSFLDTDEPLTRSTSELASQPEVKTKSLSETLNDEVPFDFGDKTEKVVEVSKEEVASTFKDDDDDWFNNLKS